MLARLRNAKENGESGFTLIELLVVMIIIGILAAIAIPAFLNQKKKAAETAAKSDATNISKEIAAALVDGPITTLTLTQAAGATSAALVATTAAGTNNATVTVSAGNAVTVTPTGTIATPGTTTYCVTATPADATLAWSAGPNGLKKGTTCP